MAENFKLVKWVNCIKEECSEGIKGYCTRGYYAYGEEIRDFPEDGKCLYPDVMEYDEEYALLGAYQEI